MLKYSPCLKENYPSYKNYNGDEFLWEKTGLPWEGGNFQVKSGCVFLFVPFLVNQKHKGRENWRWASGGMTCGFHYGLPIFSSIISALGLIAKHIKES